MEPLSDPLAGVARAELLEARKHMLKALEAIDGQALGADRAMAKGLILEAKPLIEAARVVLLAGGEDEQH
jgi:hypothetical protein